MNRKKTTLPEWDPKGLDVDEDRCNDQASIKYNDFKLDDKLTIEFADFYTTKSEPRLCVYGVPESVPFLNGGTR